MTSPILELAFVYFNATIGDHGKAPDVASPGLSSCALLARLLFHMLMLPLQIPLLTLMPMIYYHKLPLKGDCSCDRGISSLEKTRAQTVFVLPRNPLLALSGDEASVQLDVVLKNKPAPSFRIAGDLAAELKPTFIPEFHGFEMFVWSLPSPQVHARESASDATHSPARRRCNRRSRGSVK